MKKGILQYFKYSVSSLSLSIININLSLTPPGSGQTSGKSEYTDRGGVGRKALDKLFLFAPD